jgi:hypothetical protein
MLDFASLDCTAWIHPRLQAIGSWMLDFASLDCTAWIHPRLQAMAWWRSVR